MHNKTTNPLRPHRGVFTDSKEGSSDHAKTETLEGTAEVFIADSQEETVEGAVLTFPYHSEDSSTINLSETINTSDAFESVNSSDLLKSSGQYARVSLLSETEISGRIGLLLDQMSPEKQTSPHPISASRAFKSDTELQTLATQDQDVASKPQTPSTSPSQRQPIGRRVSEFFHTRKDPDPEPDPSHTKLRRGLTEFFNRHDDAHTARKRGNSTGTKVENISSSPPKSSTDTHSPENDNDKKHHFLDRISPHAIKRKLSRDKETITPQDTQSQPSEYLALLSIVEKADIDIIHKTSKSLEFSRNASELLYYGNLSVLNLSRLIYAGGVTEEMRNLLLYAGDFIKIAPFPLQDKKIDDQYVHKLHTALRYGMPGVVISLEESKIIYHSTKHKNTYNFDPEHPDEKVQAARYMAAFNLMSEMSINEIYRCVTEKKILAEHPIRGENNIDAVLTIMSEQFTECAGIMYLLTHSIAQSQSISTQTFNRLCCAHDLHSMITLASSIEYDRYAWAPFSNIFRKHIKDGSLGALERAFENIEHYRLSMGL